MWIEKYLFYPNFYQKIISFLLLPFSLLYCLIVYFKFPKKYKDKKIPIIAIGNLIVGGVGKTPLSVFLANRYKDVAVILRGYARDSKGTLLVSKNNKIFLDVSQSGDEAMEIALKTNAIVIVSENREDGIDLAIKEGAKIVILDDGFDKPFKKLNIVIDMDIKNKFCLPSGGYRYPRSFLKFADIILKENINFTRKVIVPKCNNCVLISAISKPQRLLKYIKTDKYYFFMDHHKYTKSEIESILNKFQADTILTTYKDYVKLKEFGFNIKVIDLDIEIDKKILKKIDDFIKSETL